MRGSVCDVLQNNEVSRLVEYLDSAEGDDKRLHSMAEALVLVCETQEDLLDDLLYHVADVLVDRNKDIDTMFRVDSMSVFILKTHMFRLCRQWFRDSVLGTFRVVVSVVDRMDEETIMVQPLCLKFLKDMQKSMKRNVAPLANVMHCLANRIHARFPEAQYSKTQQIVFSFLFLRVVVPSIVDPSRAGIIMQELSPKISSVFLKFGTQLQQWAGMIGIATNDEGAKQMGTLMSNFFKLGEPKSIFFPRPTYSALIECVGRDILLSERMRAYAIKKHAAENMEFLLLVYKIQCLFRTGDLSGMRSAVNLLSSQYLAPDFMNLTEKTRVQLLEVLPQMDNPDSGCFDAILQEVRQQFFMSVFVPFVQTRDGKRKKPVVVKLSPADAAAISSANEVVFEALQQSGCGNFGKQ